MLGTPIGVRDWPTKFQGHIWGCWITKLFDNDPNFHQVCTWTLFSWSSPSFFPESSPIRSSKGYLAKYQICFSHYQKLTWNATLLKVFITESSRWTLGTQCEQLGHISLTFVSISWKIILDIFFLHLDHGSDTFFVQCALLLIRLVRCVFSTP